MIVIPLVLSAYTHLWNPIGFPTFSTDESGFQLSRAMHFLETGNPRDDFSRNDSPYFGWIFLAGVLAIFGYPGSLDPSPDTNSIQMLYFYPRILMGILSIIDTFLIYKIAQTRYNTSIALIASILFAVMPLTWITRRILLESIQLPLLLSSVLFAIYTKHSETDVKNRTKRTIIFPLMSGTFMGMAIFTEITAIAFVPLVCYIIYRNTKKNIWIQDKAMMVCLSAIIIIPLLWPAHAISMGQFDQWKSDFLYQIQRQDQPLSLSFESLFKIDPVLMILGAAGIVYAAIKRDIVLLLWTLPFLAFLQIIGHVSSFFHLMPLFPPFCIAASKLALDLSGTISNYNIRRMAPLIFVSAIGLFGITSTTMLITQNLTSSFFEVYSFIAGAVPEEGDDGNDNATRMTVVGNIQYFWIPKYVLDKNQHFYESYYAWNPTETEDYLLITDRQFDQLIADNNDDRRKLRLKGLYEGSHTLALFKEQSVFNRTSYPYSGMVQVGGIGEIEIRSNSYDTPLMLEDNGHMLEPVFHGIRFPTSMAFLGPDDILVLEKNDGTVRRIVNGTMLPEPVLDANVANTNERGMLGIAIARPNDASGGGAGSGPTYVFLYYTESASDGSDAEAGAAPLGNRLYRYEFVDGKLINPKLLLDLPALPGPSNNGGAIAIGPDNNVYVTIGDLFTRVGKNSTTAANIQGGNPPDGRAGILRVTQDGEVVGAGIFGQEPFLNKYYAYGIRNSFGIDFDPVTGKLWDTENGPTYGDEINLVEPGFNSGWKKIHGIWRAGDQGKPAEVIIEPTDLVTFNGTGRYSAPEFVWNYTVTPTALKFLNSDKYAKSYQDDLLVAEFNQGNVYHFDLNQNRTQIIFNGSSPAAKLAQDSEELENLIFARTLGGITDMELGPDGYLYIVSLSGHGGSDCTESRKENCLDYDDSSSATGGIFKLVPRSYLALSK
ncbi:MAG: PQQ-dependent sugar dehydrogenase [Thermoproteota archaeon]|nr:PQQ-dependent sugar dehydrogenase [Thermoproteota archaeon]